MPILVATPIYAGALALLFLYLSARVIIYRRTKRLSVGDEGDRMLLKRMRVQANCAEYAPFGILLLALIELQSAPIWALHGLGLMLLVGRIAHAYGMSSHPQDYRFRTIGMVLTLLMLAFSALKLLVF